MFNSLEQIHVSMLSMIDSLNSKGIKQFQQMTIRFDNLNKSIERFDVPPETIQHLSSAYNKSVTEAALAGVPHVLMRFWELYTLHGDNWRTYNPVDHEMLSQQGFPVLDIALLYSLFSVDKETFDLPDQMYQHLYQRLRDNQS